jgi:hypothetical protein
MEKKLKLVCLCIIAACLAATTMIDLTQQVTGVLPVANGGTNRSVNNTVFLTSNYTNSTTGATTLLVSPSIQPGANIAFHCEGTYIFTTTAEKIELSTIASQTPQTGDNHVDYMFQYNTTNGNNWQAGTPITTTASLQASSTTASAVNTNYAFMIEGEILWNASTAGTLTFQAATTSAAGTLAINAYNFYCTLHPQ